MKVKQRKQKYIRSKIPTIVVLTLIFVALCIVGKVFGNYLIIGGAAIYAFVAYAVFYNKMMAYVEQNEIE